MLKIGIVGNNTCIDHYWLMVQEIPNCTIIASMDAYSSIANINCFTDCSLFLNEIDALLVINPSKNSHYITEKAIRNQIPCFIDSPFAPTVEDGKNLMNLVQEAKVGMQISNPIQYNEALQSVKPYISYPSFIECNRLSDINLSNNENSIVLSQMIYDIDIILNIVKSGVKKISATGVIMNNNSADVVNARIEFENGCVANLLCSRVDVENQHYIKFYQNDSCIFVDYLKFKSKIYELNETTNNTSFAVVQPMIQKNNLNELLHFIQRLQNNMYIKPNKNTLTALEIAHFINDKITQNQSILA
jgi:predicted dehydrogenase